MNYKVNEIVERLTALTTNEEINNIIEETFNTPSVESIFDGLQKLRAIAIKRHLGELLEIVDNTENTTDKTTLEQKLFITHVDGIMIDTRVFNAKSITEIVECIGFNPQKNNYYDYRDNTFKDKNDLARLIRCTALPIDVNYKLTIDSYYLTTQHGDLATYSKYVINSVVAQIRDNNQYGQIHYSVNPYIDEQTVGFDNQTMNITYNEVLPITAPFIENEEIHNDYLEHFPDFYRFLAFLLAVRFGADTKRGYIWLRAISNWGKSFLAGGVLTKLGLVAEISESELKSAYSSSASGFNAEMFTHAWVVFIDEFKSAVSELKKITHNLIFTPKFKHQVRVNVYLKLCASAETVKSLVNDGAMDEQYQNRFLIWREDSGKLTDRAIYQNNKSKYMEVIMGYTYKYLRQESDAYIALGESKASAKANAIMDEIYLLKQTVTSTKEDSMARNIDEFKRIYTESRFNLGSYFFEDKYGNIYIRNKERFVEAFLAEYYGKDEATQLNRHKESNIILGLGENPKRETKKVAGGTSKSGYLWISASKSANNTEYRNVEDSEWFNDKTS